MRYSMFCLQIPVLFLPFVALWSMESPDIEVQEKTWLTCCFRKSDCTQKLLGVRALAQHFEEFHAAECTTSASELAQTCYQSFQKEGIVCTTMIARNAEKL
jgi:hypothetical protein